MGLFLHWVDLTYYKQSANVLLEGLESQTIHITRGVRQGCPMPPLLFEDAIEVLVDMIRDKNIQGVKCSSHEIKLSLLCR